MLRVTRQVAKSSGVTPSGSSLVKASINLSFSAICVSLIDIGIIMDRMAIVAIIMGLVSVFKKAFHIKA